MANVPRSSFIPKQVTSTATPKKVRHTRIFSVIGFLAGFLLFVSLLLSGGVFIYKGVEASNLEAKRSALAAERNKFNEADIAEVRRFDKRIELARALLETHLSPSKVFMALEDTTKQSIQYTDFSFMRRPSGDVTLDLTGVTDDFAKVALQSMENSEDFILKDMAVTEVGLGTESGAEGGAARRVVTFQLISNIPASKLLFESEGLPSRAVETGTTTEPEATKKEAEAEGTEPGDAATSTVGTAPESSAPTTTAATSSDAAH